jgi:hypothetical protein
MVVFLIARASGLVRNAEVYERVRDLPSHAHSSIHVRSGGRVERTRDLFGSLDLGFVVLCHERREQVLADYQAIRDIEDQVVVEQSLDTAGARS